VHPVRGPGHWVLWSLVSAFPASFIASFFWPPAIWVAVGAMCLVALYRYAAGDEALVFPEADLLGGVGTRRRF
jgi:hypothetical protein